MRSEKDGQHIEEEQMFCSSHGRSCLSWRVIAEAAAALELKALTNLRERCYDVTAYSVEALLLLVLLLLPPH